jgi:hypothetical protein
LQTQADTQNGKPLIGFWRKEKFNQAFPPSSQRRHCVVDWFSKVEPVGLNPLLNAARRLNFI